MKSLLQFSIKDFILEEYAAYPELCDALSKRFESVKDVNSAISFVKSKGKELGIEDIDPLLEELDEIKDDLKWLRSKRGQLVLYVNSKYEEWEKSLSKKFEISGLMLRAHSEKYAICVVGTIEDISMKENILKAVEEITDLNALDHLREKV